MKDKAHIPPPHTHDRPAAAMAAELRARFDPLPRYLAAQQIANTAPTPCAACQELLRLLAADLSPLHRRALGIDPV